MAEHPFEKVRSVRAHEQIVEQLERKILRGELPAGARLPSERAMMSEFQVSRPTIREALRVAEHLGLVAVRQGDPGGPLVLGQPSVGISRVVDGMVQAEKVSAVELLEFRMLLDGAAAALASGHPRARRIAEALAEMKSASDAEAFVRADVRFHYEVAVASGNRLYPLILDGLNRPIELLIAGRLATAPETRDATLAQHGEILAKIQAGDSEGARAAARRHLFEHYGPGLSAQDRARLKRMLERP